MSSNCFTRYHSKSLPFQILMKFFFCIFAQKMKFFPKSTHFDFEMHKISKNLSLSFSSHKMNRRSASEEKYSKSLPDRETHGGRPRPTQFLTKLTPRPHLRQLRSQTSSLLSSTSITDTSDEDDESEEIHSYNERQHRRHQWF